MLKFTDVEVTFAEVPSEISLCINISNCPCQCKGCHSSYLAQDIGSELNKDSLFTLLDKNRGISCVSFMGGDANPELVNNLAFCIKEYYSKPIKVAWYSGRQELSDKIELRWFDFIKLGPYVEELGPLNNPNTNQKFYKVSGNNLIDITYKFLKDNHEN